MENRILSVLQEPFVQTTLKNKTKKNKQKKGRGVGGSRGEKRKGITGTRKERITQKSG